MPRCWLTTPPATAPTMPPVVGASDVRPPMRPRPRRRISSPKRVVLVTPCSPTPTPINAAPSHSAHGAVAQAVQQRLRQQHHEREQVAQVVAPARHQHAAAEQRGHVERALQRDQAGARPAASCRSGASPSGSRTPRSTPPTSATGHRSASCGAPRRRRAAALICPAMRMCSGASPAWPATPETPHQHAPADDERQQQGRGHHHEQRGEAERRQHGGRHRWPDERQTQHESARGSSPPWPGPASAASPGTRSGSAPCETAARSRAAPHRRSPATAHRRSAAAGTATHAAIAPRRNIVRLPWRSIQAPIGSAISSTPR